MSISSLKDYPPSALYAEGLVTNKKILKPWKISTKKDLKNWKEQELLYEQWFRASPLPRIVEEQKKRESSSKTCNKNLFNASLGQIRCDSKEKDKTEEPEVQQTK